MKSYPPSHVDPRSDLKPRSTVPPEFAPPTDETLRKYVECYWDEFRRAVELYFGAVSSALPLYSNHPYRSTIVRIGPNGVVIGHARAATSSVEVLRPEDFDPPLEDYNIFRIQDRVDAELTSFDFRFRAYPEEEARIDGARAAFEQALGVFWHILKPIEFEKLCHDLLVADGVNLEQSPQEDFGVDASGTVYFDEPGRFVREEAWGFQLKHSSLQRPSAALVRETEERLERQGSAYDILCILSSGDLTSIGRHVVVESPRVRVWDRSVLNILLHRHPDVLKRYFAPYAAALERIEADLAKKESFEARFRAALQGCPPGQRHFRAYEDLGLEVLRFLFPVELGPPRVQSRTDDGVERRDVVSRNNRTTRFFERVGERFNADFIIWDFKNYGDPITGEVVSGVAMYANLALGRLIVIVSRDGAGDSCQAAQLRRFRNDNRMVLVVSDNQLLEMVRRRETGGSPEDVLEDLLDELLLAF